MAEVKYRLAEVKDLPAVASQYESLNRFFHQFTYRFPEVENLGQVWVESYQRTLGRYSILYVAETAELLAGFCLGRIKRVAPYLGGVLVGELSDIWVEPDFRRAGLGAELSRLVFAWLKAQGVYSVEVQILEGNQPIWQLYESMGFHTELRQIRMFWEDYQPYPSGSPGATPGDA